MTETDARMSFERHATSKIRQASDLFAIRTMGFRGEALASIAAIAPWKCAPPPIGRAGRPASGGRFNRKEPGACQCSSGTAISVKNLFFNVPARPASSSPIPWKCGTSLMNSAHRHRQSGYFLFPAPQRFGSVPSANRQPSPTPDRHLRAQSNKNWCR